MVKTFCELTTGEIVEYIAAFPVESTIPVSSDLIYLGIGRIYSYGDRLWTGDKAFKFYLNYWRAKRLLETL